MSGQRVCVSDFEEEAKKVLPKAVYDYYRSGANEQNTLAYNVAAFNRYKSLSLSLNVGLLYYLYIYYLLSIILSPQF